MALRLLTQEEDEEERIEAARAGDESARQWLVAQYTPAVYRFCYRMLRNEEDARDVTQETLIKVMRNLDRYDASRRFSSWVFGIARNTAIDEARRRRRVVDASDTEFESHEPSPLEESSRQQRARKLQDALDELPAAYREILVLYHFEHLKYHEIAEALGIPIGTVMNRIFRARKQLRDLYGEEA